MMVRDFTSTEKQIVETARAYLGVPFRHQGRNRYGLDCLGLLVRVADDCELRLNGSLIARQDETDYGHLADPQRLYEGLVSVLVPIKEIKAGCVLLMEIDDVSRHLGIVGDYSASDFSFIHAYAPAKKVVEHRLDSEWKHRVREIFCFVGD